MSSGSDDIIEGEYRDSAKQPAPLTDEQGWQRNLGDDPIEEILAIMESFNAPNVPDELVAQWLEIMRVEVRRLRAENERLRSIISKAIGMLHGVPASIKELLRTLKGDE